MLFSICANAQYAEQIHLEDYEYFFLKEYALREIYYKDANTIRTNNVKAVITTDSSGKFIYDTLIFNKRGNLIKHVQAASDLRNDIDGYLEFTNQYYDVIYESVVSENESSVINTKSQLWHFNNFDKLDNVYKLTVLPDSLLFRFYNLFSNAGNDYYVKHLLSGYEKIDELIQTRMLRGSKLIDNNESYKYFYDTNDKINKLIHFFDGNIEFRSVDVKYSSDTVAFLFSDYNKDVSDWHPDRKKEIYVLKNGRIQSKRIEFPENKNVEPVYISTHYEYNKSGLIEFTTTGYIEYKENSRTEMNKGVYKKYYRYEYY